MVRCDSVGAQRLRWTGGTNMGTLMEQVTQNATPQISHHQFLAFSRIWSSGSASQVRVFLLLAIFGCGSLRKTLELTVQDHITISRRTPPKHTPRFTVTGYRPHLRQIRARRA